MPCSPGRRLDDVDHEDRGPLRPGVGLPPATKGVFYMGQITQDGDIAKKGSLFLELWAIIVATLKGVESKPRCFLASFC